MIHRYTRRLFSNGPTPLSNYWPYAKWLVAIPTGIFAALAIYEYKAERERIDEWLAEHQEEVIEEDPFERLVRKALNRYAGVRKMDFDDSEAREKLRSACIDHGIPPKDYNSFYQVLSTFKAEEPLAKQVFETCMNPTKVNECRVLVEITEMFDFIN